MSRGTLIKAPPRDPNKSPIENALEVLELGEGSNIFTNRREAWYPAGARGIYGGSVIALCLAAAQKTVPDTFTVHSYHCFFLLAGSADIPLLFHVERVRDGRSFATRTVQARQRGRCIFTTTMSFVREGSAGPPANQLFHAYPAPTPSDPDFFPPPPDNFTNADTPSEIVRTTNGPLQFSHTIISPTTTTTHHPLPHAQKVRQWTRARGTIVGGHTAHLNALAYLSDAGFVGTIPKVHRVWQFPFSPDQTADILPEVLQEVRKYNEFTGLKGDLSEFKGGPELGMMVSLDHTIYFHEPRKVKADEWLFREMESWWSGDGRGVVFQRIYAKDGTLLATCIQEGLVRLKRRGESICKSEERSKAKM